jgi:hypothetical protein
VVCSFFEAGYDGDAGGFGGDVVGDAFVGRVHELVKDEVRGFNALIELLYVGRGGGGDGERHGEGCSGAECLKEPLVHSSISPFGSHDFNVCSAMRRIWERVAGGRLVCGGVNDLFAWLKIVQKNFGPKATHDV